MRSVFQGIAVICLLAGGQLGTAQVSVGPTGPDGLPLYAVECSRGTADGASSTCVVDRYTYVGWRVFHRTCHVCHAQDAVGSQFAPNLVNRIRQMDSDEFFAAMDNGYAGDIVDMPAWGSDPAVRPYFFELWAYLSARASGDLLPGEPGVGEN